MCQALNPATIWIFLHIKLVEEAKTFERLCRVVILTFGNFTQLEVIKHD